PKIFTWLAGWGEIAMTGGRNIPYFIVPIIAPIIGACVGAAIYRYLIAKNLPVNSVAPKEISE
ncbi:TPA: aquaporin, partial [Escherichia coli]